MTRIFVTGDTFNTPASNVSKSGSYTPTTAATRPAAAFNTQPTPTPAPQQRKPAMTTQRPSDAALLRELASQTINNATFSINTNNLQDAAKRLRDALGYVDRLIQAAPATNAATIGKPGDEFANYSINDL